MNLRAFNQPEGKSINIKHTRSVKALKLFINLVRKVNKVRFIKLLHVHDNTASRKFVGLDQVQLTGKCSNSSATFLPLSLQFPRLSGKA